MDNQVKRWYALYTKSRSEKKAERELIERGIEVYLPMYKTLRQWSDRKKWVQLPLFSSYIFVRIFAREQQKAMYAPGVAGFVRFEGNPAPIPDKQIQNIKLILTSGHDFEVVKEHYEVGEKVLVEKGNLQGLTGTLVEKRGKHKVLVQIDSMEQALTLDVPLTHIAKAGAVGENKK